MPLNLNNARKCLADFEFSKLFIEELGWSRPSSRLTVSMTCKAQVFSRRQVAQLAGVVVFEVTAQNGQIPDARTRAALHKEIAAHHHENLLIFVDALRTQSLWYWVRRKNGKTFPRDHIYVRGQPGDLFLSKINSMFFDIREFDETGNVPLVEVTDRLREALDIERVTKRFYTEFQDQHIAFLELIEGIDDERDRRWYASVLLNRLMFIYFLQRKFFLNNRDGRYLQNKLEEIQKRGPDLYYEEFLKVLFFEGFAKPEEKRSSEANKLLGKIKYLNGGLFLLHPVEEHWPEIRVPDEAFENLFGLFERYSWNLNDTPGGQDNEINPDVLGYIFEKYINQKAFGAYYTRPEITQYLCERTIHRLVLDRVNSPGIPGILAPRRFDNIGDMLLNLDAALCKELLHDVLPNLRLLDPACGSAAFLVAAMKTLINIYAAVVGKIEFLGDRNLKHWLAGVKRDHPSIDYFIKKTIITENLFGVDIMEEAVEIAKLRLFLALVAAAGSEEDLEPLPNIDFNIVPGNSLIGLMRVDDKEFERRTANLNLFRKTYAQILAEKNRMVDLYRHATTYAEDLRTLRDQIDGFKKEAVSALNAILVGEFTHLGIKYEQATWDEKKDKEGRPEKRSVTLEDIETLKPFHWGFEFDEIINKRGGFDAIITNPPWEIFKPNSKEFFEEYSALVTVNKMTIKEFEKERSRLLRDKDIRKAWLAYMSRYPHLSAFFRTAAQYKNQISVLGGKKAGTDINLYKLFTEQCFNLLRNSGYCGIVIPSGIYTDLGAKQLREMLFTQTEVTALFCFENRKGIFENVDSRYKFLVLTFEKGGETREFPAAFMRHDASELDRFPQEGAIEISVDLIRRLSPDSLSLMEFKNESEVHFSDAISRHPPLGSGRSSYRHVKFSREIDPTAHPEYVSTSKQKGMCPLLEGRNIHQFTHLFSTDIRFWVKESEGRHLVLGRVEDRNRLLDYQVFRLGFRKIARNTDERTMISTVIPPSFASENLQTTCVLDMDGKPIVSNTEMLLLSAIFNSFVFDAIIRLKVSANMNFFFVYSTQVPLRGSSYDGRMIDRAARLICTTPEFDDLAKEVGLESHKDGATDPLERARLRAELDGLVAHLYGLTEEEFAYILTTFPLVPDPVKIAAHNAYRNVEKGLIK
jgi:Eco57I restriction-modification methylase